MRNEEWFNFYSEFKKFVEAVSPEKLNIEKLFVVFVSLYITVDKIIEKIRKSGVTKRISELDKLRDKLFRGLLSMIKSYKQHFDDAKRKAAESLEPLLSHYGNLAIKPYNEETAGIYNFLQEFRENYSDAIRILELETWLDELERSNQLFEEAILARNREDASKSKLHLLDIRKQIDHCYREIIERLEAVLLLEEDEKQREIYISFFKTLNTNIKRYADTLAQRKGRADAKKNENDEND
jgi:hypothetical protein